MKQFIAVAVLGMLTSMPLSVAAQSKSLQEANQHHRNQQRATEQRRQQDNRTVQQYNNNARRR